jgi:methyl coenzyme M reductase subunit C-like uncharacterized protein (methanogenesis marker protein 7)
MSKAVNRKTARWTRSRNVNANANLGSRMKKLIDKVESNTASRPGPVPPNHVLSRMAGRKSGVRKV